MKEYLIAMIGVSLLSFLARQLGVFGDNKYVGFVCGICLVAVTLNPIFGLVEWIDELDIGAIIDEGDEKYEEYSNYFDSYLTDTYIAQAQSEIEDLICSEYGLSEDNVSVSLYYGEGDEIYIFVTLTGKGIFADTNKMKARLTGLYGCEAQIVIGK